MQDNEEDWLKKSASMSAAYGGSGLNIAAAGASDGNRDLFFDSYFRQL